MSLSFHLELDGESVQSSWMVCMCGLRCRFSIADSTSLLWFPVFRQKVDLNKQLRNLVKIDKYFSLLLSSVISFMVSKVADNDNNLVICG